MTKSAFAGAEKQRLISTISLLRFGHRRAGKSYKPILSLKAISKALGTSPTTIRRYLQPTLNRTGADTIKRVGRPSKLRSKHIEYLIS